MLAKIIDEFRLAKTWGVKVLVLPEGLDAMESDILATSFQQPADSASMIVGISPAKALPMLEQIKELYGVDIVEKVKGLGNPGKTPVAVRNEPEEA